MAPFTLAVHPDGTLALRAARDGETELEPKIAQALSELSAAGAGSWLLHLGWVEAHSELCGVAGFWRDLARSAVSAFCSAPGVEETRERTEVQPAPESLEQLLERAPPMPGAEYLSLEVLRRAWDTVLAQLGEAVRAAKGETVESLISSRNPAWHVVGKVHLHLAENKNDEDHPFAFLASFTTGVSEQGKPRHRPLGDAVRDSVTARDKERLLALLAPVKRAAQQSPLVKELVDSSALFRPQRWTAPQAHAFLKEIPRLEQSGVVVRVPDWWKARSPPRPQVNVALGNREPNAMGLDALLDFDVTVSLEGEVLSEAELKALQKQGEGLTLLKGRWVEIDAQKLNEVLSHWRRAQQAAREGLSFAAAMRLLSGAAIDGAETPLEVREWSSVGAGGWLRDRLRELRDPASGDALPGAELKTELRPYQREGVQWLWFLGQLRLGACLADDMGLGKTVQVLALLLTLKRRDAAARPTLLVAPASLLANWEAEAARFAPSLSVAVVHPSRKSVEAPAADLVVTTYGSVARQPWLAQRDWGLVVLDEAQAIKNPGAQQTKAVKQLKARARVALTGTPVENRLGDLWSLFDFLNPGLLGSAKQFSQFVKKSDSYAPLRSLTRPYLLRRLKTDKSVIADLPEKTELKAYCALTKKQAALYQQAVDELARKVKTLKGIERRGLVLASLTRLKQICNHPSQWLGDAGYAADESGKHERLAQLCEEIASRQEKLLVFTQFRELTLPLASWLEALFGEEGLVLSGDTKVKERQALVKRFQESDGAPFFVLSLKAGGTGLNLTRASHVIHFDRWWNPAVENQATDRAFRIGQKRNVLVHKFICRGTVEERVDQLIEGKQGLSRELLEAGDELKLTELGDAELLKMVALDLDAAASDR